MNVVGEVLKKRYPSLEGEIFQYICGVLDSPDDFEASEDVYEAVGVVLLESVEESDEDEVKGLCQTLYRLLTTGGGGGGGGADEENGAESAKTENLAAARLLEAPVQLSSKLKVEDNSMSSIWMVQGAETRKNVDQAKLDKAEAKLKQKQDRKVLKDKEAKPKESVLAGPTTNQAVSKQSGQSSASGVVGDIKIENFDIAYGNNMLLSSAELNLVFGRRYGLIGRNGVGKTTLLRSLAGRELQLPAAVRVLHVEQEVVGDDTTAVDSVLESDEERTHLLRRERQLVGGGREEGLSPVSPVSSTGSDALTEVYSRLHEIEADKAPARAAQILSGLGFTLEMQTTVTKKFSGGWRMRIALARALFARPDLLLLDEPTNMLDLRAVLWLEGYLQSWPTTVLLVSHDRAFLTNVCTDMIHMHSQQLDCYRGNYERFLQTRTERLKNQQREYDAQMQYRQHLQDYIDRWRYNANRAPQAQMKLKILQKLPVLKPVQKEPDVIIRFPEVDKISPPILLLNEVSFGYDPLTPVFKSINISADFDSRIALVGENGSGKTTLVKLLTGELVPQDGFRNAHRNLKIAYFTQHHVDQLVLDVSALELIQSKYPGKKEEEYRHQLGSFGISGDLALRPIASLSGGQKSRLAFALLAMPRPNFLILDEPTNHLDVATVEALGKALAKFKGGVVLVAHDQHLIQLCATEVWLCKGRGVRRLEGGLNQYKTAVENEFRTQ